MRKVNLLLILAGIVLSIGCSMLFPSNVGKAKVIDDVPIVAESSFIKQKVSGLTLTPYDITKVYYKSELIGVMIDETLIADEVAAQQASLSEQQASIYNVSLSSDIILIKEKTFFVYENNDERIVELLKKQGMFVVKAIAVNIYDSQNKLLDTVYINSEEEFASALRRFAKNFIDDEVYVKLEKGETIASLTTYGQQEVNIYIAETIKATESGAQVNEILTSEEEIFRYLCYGKNPVEKYYSVVEYDTVAGVATKNGLSTAQLLSINPDIINADQTLVVGQQINIAYFTSPITVVVEKESYVKEVTYPGTPQYIKDETIPAGTMITEVEAQNGYNDALYTEIYVNGVLSGYRQEKVIVMKEPVTGVFLIGAGSSSYQGNIQFILPCKNPAITCDYHCYSGHSGTDFINIYDRYGEVLSCTDGIVTQNGYSKAAGNYYRIDAGTDVDEDGTSHHIVVRYGHMKVPGYFPVGTEVVRGQVIGQIGSTGRSSGPHVHISIYDNGIEMNPCKYLPCELARKY